VDTTRRGDCFVVFQVTSLINSNLPDLEHVKIVMVNVNTDLDTDHSATLERH
jgi:hypothetical protein